MNNSDFSDLVISSKNKLIIIGMLIVIISIVIWIVQSQNHDEIAGIRCDSMEQNVFHIHAHLDVFINGQPYLIPAGIGIIQNTCIYWLHTHDYTGIIHIESPTYHVFKLGKFFQIWEMTGKSIPLFFTTRGYEAPTSVYVNGNKTDQDYRDISLNPHDEIVIIFGTPPSKIPANYDFPYGL